MEALGINAEFFIVQFTSFLLLGGWGIFSLFTLLALRRRQLTATPQAIWVALIVFAPLFGALAFWMVKPGSRE